MADATSLKSPKFRRNLLRPLCTAMGRATPGILPIFAGRRLPYKILLLMHHIQIYFYWEERLFPLKITDSKAIMIYLSHLLRSENQFLSPLTDI